MGRGQSLVDTRMQRFLGNALADLTRPAPVVAASAVVSNGYVNFRVQGQKDARTWIDVYDASGHGEAVGTSHGALVCHDCPGHFTRRRRTGATYAVVSADQWGASAPTTVVIRPGRRPGRTR
jgi:hypothetical protein